MANDAPGPRRTGSVEPLRRADGTTYYRARIRLADGSRVRVDVPAKYCTPAGGKTGRERAELYAEAAQEREDETGELAAKAAPRGRRGTPGAGETADAWFDRYLPTKECGENHRRISGRNWANWITPVFGHKPMASIGRDDVEDVRDKLDAAIDRGEIRHATAQNVWSTLTSALKAAYAARDRKLRVLPAPLGVILPPKKGNGRQRPWLYPLEWELLMRCPAVPIEARHLYAIALYSGLRPGELRALTWGGDVDLTARIITVSKSFDETTGETKAPKTETGQRIVPIHENLLPLLEAVQKRGGQTLAAMSGRVAGRFREHLALAGVTRERLTADTETEEAIDFRSLRDSHATWLALANVPHKIIQRRLGHKSGDTTDRYIKAAESFGVKAIGEPFPPLDFGSAGDPIGPSTRPSDPQTPRKMAPRSRPLRERFFVADLRRLERFGAEKQALLPRSEASGVRSPPARARPATGAPERAGPARGGASPPSLRRLPGTKRRRPHLRERRDKLGKICRFTLHFTNGAPRPIFHDDA